MSEKKVTRNIKIEDARLIFKNFKGERSEYNDEGNRNFGVILNDELASELIEEGWHVKFLRPAPDDPEEYRRPWLPVKVKFGKIPPIIQLISSRGKIALDEDTVGQLDWTPAIYIDLIIRPYNYPALKGRSAGVSAYLKAIYYTKDEDEFELKYSDVPDLDGDRGER